MKKLYVGNLPYTIDENAVSGAFEQFGNVAEVTLIRDRETQRPRGFGFVTFDDDGAADKAVAEMNGQDFEGRKLIVNEARERTGGGGGGRGGDRGGRGGRGGNY